jgi:hypothetical protein
VQPGDEIGFAASQAELLREFSRIRPATRVRDCLIERLRRTPKLDPFNAATPQYSCSVRFTRRPVFKLMEAKSSNSRRIASKLDSTEAQRARQRRIVPIVMLGVLVDLRLGRPGRTGVVRALGRLRRRRGALIGAGSALGIIFGGAPVRDGKGGVQA